MLLLLLQRKHLRRNRRERLNRARPASLSAWQRTWASLRSLSPAGLLMSGGPTRCFSWLLYSFGAAAGAVKQCSLIGFPSKLSSA